MGCGGSNAAPDVALLEIKMVHMVPKCKGENDLLVIPRKQSVPGIMANDAGSDWYKSMPGSQEFLSEEGDFKREISLADKLGFPDPPDYACLQQHVRRLETFRAEIEAQPLRFVKLIVDQRSQMDSGALGQKRLKYADVVSCAGSHHPEQSAINPSRVSSCYSSEAMSCATTAASTTIDENDWWDMDFRTDEQIKKIRDMAQDGASKPRMLTHVRVSGKQAANTA